jgi:hypothetical protein
VRPWCRWECSIKMDLKEIGCVVWTGFVCLMIGSSGGSCEHDNFRGCVHVRAPAWEFVKLSSSIV